LRSATRRRRVITDTHRFDHPVWDLRDVIGWVLDRDPTQFGRIHNTEDAKSAVNIALFYNGTPRTETGVDQRMSERLTVLV